MKLEKYIEVNCNSQIWRLLINKNDYLLIETRDAEKKEVFFSVLDLQSKKIFMNNFQFDEKFWLGIDGFYDNIIFFHNFPKTDLPAHNEIIAFDIFSKKIVWHNQQLAFLFVFEDVVYTYQQGFDGKLFFSVDSKSGNRIKQLTDSEFSRIQNEQRIEEDEKYFEYKFPEELSKLSAVNYFDIAEEKVIGNLQSIDLENYILVSYNKELAAGKYSNIFRVFQKENKLEIFSRVLDADLDKLALDTFFVYKDLLFLIVEKKVLEIFRLEK